VTAAHSTTPNRVTAAYGLLADFENACAGDQPDWLSWATRLAGALSSIASLAEHEHADRVATVALNDEMANLLEITSAMLADLGGFESAKAA
jgi:hypothetical protein